MYELLKQEGRAKRGILHTVHGDIQTPVFMNVAPLPPSKAPYPPRTLEQIKMPGRTVKYLPPARPHRRQADPRSRRTP